MVINNDTYYLKKLLKNSALKGVYLLIVLLDYLDIWVPRFCYHTKLSSSGNCRMCLVEVKGSVKPLVSCCTIVNNGMIVYTSSILVRRSREFIMEFLLINHPLDCPVCDQAGECDLQDLSLIYGSDDSRFRYSKKAVLNKKISSLILTNMNRCIFCTRCVRYTTELNNNYTFNTLGRGVYSEIGSYYEQLEETDNYINGNVIDLCPVGALTAKPYSFRNRTWEIVSVESIDILDSLCSNIRIDTRNNVVERILPKCNDNINEEWITDKIRFCYDGFKKQRLSFPFYKLSNSTNFVLCSWHFIFSKISLNYNILYSLKRNNNFFSMFTGHLLDTFSLHIVKTLCSSVGINNININLGINFDLRKYFIFNNNIRSFDLNNVFIIVGSNPKVDTPILNMKLRTLKYKFSKKISICYVGSKLAINYSLKHLGIGTNSLVKLLYGKSFFCKIIKDVYNIVCLFGIGFSYSLNSALPISLDLISYYLKKQNLIYNFITLLSSDVSIFELGIASYYFTKSLFIHKTYQFTYLFGVDYSNMRYSNNLFVLYQGHHGNVGLLQSNIILPSSMYLENTTVYLNCEGRLFVSNKAINKKGKVHSDHSIIYNLFTFIFYNMVKNNKIRVFLLFFYKLSLFFTKYKIVNKFIIPLNIKSSLFVSDTTFCSFHKYYSMDVLSKSSYYILNMKDSNSTSLNFIS